MIILCKKQIDEKYYKENFCFIIDHSTFKDEDAYSYNRNFLKELGLKGDYVGWCNMKELTPEKLTELFSKAKAERVQVRGIYELSLAPDYESEWYEIVGTPVSETIDVMDREVYCDEGEKYYLSNIRAFAMPHNVIIADRTLCDFSCFREDVVRAVEEKGFSGIEFIWIPDVGRFESKQFYDAFPKEFIPWCYNNICSFLSNKTKASEFHSLSTCSQIIAENCRRLDLDLPLAVEKSLLPDCDFAGIYSADTQHHRFLTRKHCRDFLIEAGFAKPEHFVPVIITDNIQKEDAKPLLFTKSGNFRPVPQRIKDEIALEYKKHCKKIKPKRVATEKLALQRLRSAKKANSELFGKRVSEKVLSSVLDERLMPYYKIADGGVISDEYTFFSVKETAEETENFWKYQSLENTDIIPETAVVFGCAADGELIILLPDGEVVRYQQGQIDFSFRWNNPESFFMEETE